VRSEKGLTTTSAVFGNFRSNINTRQEFLSLIK
jgi:GTP cyclohydrolase I